MVRVPRTTQDAAIVRPATLVYESPRLVRHGTLAELTGHHRPWHDNGPPGGKPPPAGKNDGQNSPSL